MAQSTNVEQVLNRRIGAQNARFYLLFLCLSSDKLHIFALQIKITQLRPKNPICSVILPECC